MSWIRPGDHNIFVNAGSLLLCGLITGVAVAAAVFPVAAISGLATEEAVTHFGELPDELTVLDGPQISYIYASDGETQIATMYDENRRNITLDEVPQVVVDALLSAEDRNFYEHNGVDVRGIARAFVANVDAGETTQGASTITQQFVRLALTYFADHPQDVVEATEETTARKLREARLAMAVEQRMSKEEILQRYLNLAYFGEGAYGIFAASQVYFDKRPMDLEIHEAATLVGIIRAPSLYSPSNEERLSVATERRDWVIDQMVETGAVTPAEAADAKAVELEANAQRQPNECVNTTENHWGFFCDYFYRWWMEQETFGASPWDRERRLKGGGYHIVTTLDVDTQAAMKENVDDQIDTSVDEPHALMLAAVEPGTGKVRAMATNRVFSLDESDNGPHTNPVHRERGHTGTYPHTTNPLMSGGGDITGYQGGSTFKIFTLLTALQEGLPLDYSIFAPFRVTTDFVVAPGGPASCGNNWCPVNYSTNVTGQHNMWSGFGESVNTYFAQLIERVGADTTVELAKDLGIEFRSRGTPGNPSDYEFSQNPEGWGAFTLGVSATTPLDVAGAFATVSAEGMYCKPLPVEEIRTADGESLDLASPSCERAVDPEVARAAIDAGQCVVGIQSEYGMCTGGTETFQDGIATRDIVGKPFWGKTGTTDGAKSASLTLSTKQLAVSGFLTDPDWADTDQTMSHGIVNPAVIYTLRDAMEGVEAQDWPSPSADIALGEQVGIPDVECDTVTEARSALQDAGFEVQVSDSRVDSSCQAGRAAGTNPSGSTAQDGVVEIEVSNGSGYEDQEDDEEPGPPDETDPTAEPGPPAATSPPARESPIPGR